MTDLIQTSRPAAPRTIEWPTVFLALVIHAGWLAATFWHDRLPPLALFAIGGWLIAWHGSLQHEIIHGHPTPWRRVNALLGAAPLNLWLPFEVYRRSHLAHHAVEHLTDPAHDPESRYLAPGDRAMRRAFARAQATLLGRLILGPILEIGGFLAGQGRALARGDKAAWSLWALHLLALAPVLLWLVVACHFPLPLYGLCFVYPGAALSLLRSYAEHRAEALPAHRVAVVERAPLLGLLFLNNNLHAAHHAWPGAPWFTLKRLYATHREQLLRDNGGLVYDGYGDVARQFLFRAHDRVEFAPGAAAIEGAVA
jgi:fatty acid desaturase